MMIAQVNPGYDWENPTLAVTLPEALEEVSGLSMGSSDAELLAVADEEGTFFRLSATTGEVLGEVDFWDEGDYEGIEQVGDRVYVVKSSGTVYEVLYVGTDTQRVHKYNDYLGKENDVEGFSYCPITQHLLLACKAEPGDELDEDQTKAIYAFDPAQGRLLPQPRLLMRRDSVEQFLKRCEPGPFFTKICDIFDSEEEAFKLTAAALAVHPHTGNYYLTSSKGELLVVITPAGGLVELTKLPKALHPQPEGLCFDSAGNLFIANEARKDEPARLYRYDMVK